MSLKKHLKIQSKARGLILISARRQRASLLGISGYFIFKTPSYCAYHINRDTSRRVLYSDVIRKVFFTTFARGVSRDQTRFFFYGNISNLN